MAGQSRLIRRLREVPAVMRSSVAADADTAAGSDVATRVPLAIVQHGHQYLITDGYDNREGLSEILEAFATIFALHLKYRIPLNLHLSGTLIEAIAWHSPAFFEWVRALRDNGLLEMVGSSYSQNILTLFSPEHNLRQLNETLALYRHHLGVEPAEVKVLWVPERVWQTKKLAPLLRSRRLLNRGYDYVLLDSRLAYSLDGRYETSERAAFDLRSAPCLWQAGRSPSDDGAAAVGDGPHLHPLRIEGGHGLIALPLSAELRYCIPPRQDSHWAHLRDMLRLTGRAGPGTIAIYGDDLEKTATLGPWTSGRWRRESVAAYERFLQWLQTEPAVEPLLLSSRLVCHPPEEEKAIDEGSFYELARVWGAGEDYSGWWRERAWEPYRKLLRDAEVLLLQSAPCNWPGLRELAWKQLMASSCETAWHSMDEDGTYHPAPWARAVASHVRSVFVIAAAARWGQERDGRAHVERTDLDRDGREEVVLKNDHLYAVFTPAYGGRLIYLFDYIQNGGRLVIGNPADDWNWQEEPNRYMEIPRNHPGAFADAGHENDRYKVQACRTGEMGAELRLVNQQKDCALAGTVKVFRLGPDSRFLEGFYHLAQEPERFSMEFCLSPDYLVLLREGRRVLRSFSGRSARGCRNGLASVWVRLPPGEPLLWDSPQQQECGHGIMLRLTAYRREFRIQLGVGPTSGTGGEMAAWR